MAVQTFNCPNCGAPIDYDGSDTPTIRCPFCETSVVVPAELRPRPEPAQPVEFIQIEVPREIPSYVVTPAPPRRNSGLSCVVAVIAVIVLLVAVGAMVVPLIVTSQAERVSSEITTPVKALLTQVAGPLQNEIVTLTAEPSETPTLAFTPTPSFARLLTTFGSKGIGAGLLNDARYIAVDGTGAVYVADYQDGRIQAFDSDGKFLHGWQAGDSKTIIQGMAANHQGTLFVAYDGDIYRYEGANGKLLGKITYAKGPEFGDLAATLDGGVVGAWYEGRWGLITSLEGHRDDLVWFDAGGKALRSVQGFISGQTDSLALDNMITVDGQGTIFTLSDGEVFKFTAQGKYLNRFSPQIDPSGSDFFNAIAVDGKGRLFIAGSDQVAIFSADGRFLRSFQTEISVERMAFNEANELFLLGGDQVARYGLGDIP